jgi:CheY-like chemotaxis protein
MMSRVHFGDVFAAGREIPAILGSILLVEPNAELRESRRLLLGSLEHPVLAVCSYAEVCELPTDGNCRLVAIDVQPSEHEAARIAMHVRRHCPYARILLLGPAPEGFEDALYDDAVSAYCNPAGVVDAASRLLAEPVWQL